MQKSTFSAQARTQNRTDKTTKEENDKQPTETPKTHTHTYNRYQDQRVNRDETIFMLTKEFTKAIDSRIKRRRKSQDKRERKKTSTNNRYKLTSDKIKRRNNINYLGWVPLFTHTERKRERNRERMSEKSHKIARKLKERNQRKYYSGNERRSHREQQEKPMESMEDNVDGRTLRHFTSDG